MAFELFWIENEYRFFKGLCRAGSVLPSQDGLRSVLRQHRVATLGLYLRNVAIRQDRRFELHLSFKVTVSQDVGIFGFHSHDHFAV